jgi:hypothetical protein
MVVRDFVALDHFDRFVHPWIERLAFCRNSLHVHPLQCILKLAINELHAFAQIFRLGFSIPHRQPEAIDYRQQATRSVRYRVIPIVGVFFGRAFAPVIELRLQAGQPIQQVIAFGAKLLQLI